MMLVEGQSGGHIGYECINSTSYDGKQSVCGPDEEMIDVEKQFTCGETTPYCVQCGPRCWGGALCLSSPDVGNRPCATTCWEDNTDDAEVEDFLPPSTPASEPIPELFDQCESDEDVAAWTENGGEATLVEFANWCSTEQCLGDNSICIEMCFQDYYGYSAECSKCFGAFPDCSVGRGCTSAW